MAISFPSSPSVGQEHTHNNLKWRWDGTSWVNIGGDHEVYHVGEFSNRPTTPVDTQIYFNTLNGTMEMYNGTEWVAVSQDNRQYLHRTVITTSYVLGGYQSGSPWYNVNSMNHSTDLTNNLGDLLATKASYASGACGKVYAYIWNANNTHNTANVTNAHTSRRFHTKKFLV